ncbi:MAG: hypothetical protein ACJ71H_13360 [Nitrososphaeraceae archaeon]
MYDRAKGKTMQTVTPRRSNSRLISMASTTIADPWMLILYIYTKIAQDTREKYMRTLTKILDFLGYQGTKEANPLVFADHAKHTLFEINSIPKLSEQW